MSSTPLTDAALDSLVKFPKLAELDLQETSIIRRAINRFRIARRSVRLTG